MIPELQSKYIIDGVPQEFSPAELLGLSSEEVAVPSGAGIVDETVDPALETFKWNPRSIESYSSALRTVRWSLPVPFAAVGTRFRMAVALTEAIWRKGHFSLTDLGLKAAWKWNPAPVGNQAAFYKSVQAAAEYADSLGVGLSLSDCSFDARDCDVSFKACLSGNPGADEYDTSVPPVLRQQRGCPDKVQPDFASWLAYIPFDTSDYRLGGSLLAQSMGMGGGVSPQIQDADYFMDCYEVVRELVEDGIVMSGVSVVEGGLLAAAKKLCAGGPGATLDISDAMRAFEEDNAVKVLFAEIPGVIIQIKDMDFDYVDAEMLLQDVAWFPLGHPNPKSSAVKVKASSKSGIQNILESLMQNAEGED